MKKGFTLVELLAVIVIIGLIATITSPIITDVITTSKRKSFEDSAIMLTKAAQNYYSSLTLDDTVKIPILVTFDEKNETNKYLNNNTKTCETSSKRILPYSGVNPDSGNIYIDNSGNIIMAIYSKAAGECAIKNASDKTVTFSNKSQSECKLENSPCWWNLLKL